MKLLKNKKQNSAAKNGMDRNKWKRLKYISGGFFLVTAYFYLRNALFLVPSQIPFFLWYVLLGAGIYTLYRKKKEKLQELYFSLKERNLAVPAVIGAVIVGSFLFYDLIAFFIYLIARTLPVLLAGIPFFCCLYKERSQCIEDTSKNNGNLIL